MSATATGPELASPPRGLRALWAATAVSSLGDGAYLAAAPLLAATLTQSPVAISLVSTATLAPWFLVGPFAGALVDRWPRRTVMITADLIRAACVLALAVLILADLATIAGLATVGFILTSGQSFHNAAAQAMIPNLTGRDRAALASANSRIATTESVAAGFVGPPLGSSLFSLAPWLPLAADATSFAASATLLRAVPASPAPRRTGKGLFASLAQATRWMLHHRQLLELALLIAGGNLATNAALATFVLYAHQDLGVTTWGFGLLLASQAIGATLGGWVATRMSKHLSFRAMLPIAQLSRAIAFLSLALMPSPYIAGACMSIIGASFTVGTVAAVSARQQLVPDDMLGRVVNVFRLIGNGAAPIGAAIGGVLAARYALDTPIIAGGLFTLGVAALSLLPQFRPRPAPNPPDNTHQH
ncbi:MFS transporter [Micromonospora sp. NPDC048830]|uniref:MFS transporter n=1 Tax=Micromonospora sp. NPDC048830 TaxID=3364257 RepID=UPI00371884EB